MGRKSKYPKACGIYCLINPYGEIYIGQSINIRQRMTQYRHSKRNFKINVSIRQFGLDNHELKILHELPIDANYDVFCQYELLYYEQFKECRFSLLNIQQPFGRNGKHSTETKEKMSAAHIGKPISEEHKNILRNMKKGKQLHPNTRNAQLEYIKNHVATPETNRKISDTMLKIWAERRAGKV